MVCVGNSDGFSIKRKIITIHGRIFQNIIISTAFGLKTWMPFTTIWGSMSGQFTKYFKSLIDRLPLYLTSPEISIAFPVWDKHSRDLKNIKKLTSMLFSSVVTLWWKGVWVTLRDMVSAWIWGSRKNEELWLRKSSTYLSWTFLTFNVFTGDQRELERIYFYGSFTLSV